MIFHDRADAGRQLAARLAAYADRDDVLVLGLPRGGVPVAYEVAAALRAPLDVFVVRKLGVPGHEELAMGAIATGGVRVINQEVVQGARISADTIERVTERECNELERRERTYRGQRPPIDPSGRIAILVDDGLATGSTMRAAIRALRLKEPRAIVVAVPTASPQTCNEFRDEVDDIICAATPEPFYAVGIWYEDFAQTTDDDVRALLESAEQWRPSAIESPETWQEHVAGPLKMS